jgi:hypothetical protein
MRIAKKMSFLNDGRKSYVPYNSETLVEREKSESEIDDGIKEGL